MNKNVHHHIPRLQYKSVIRPLANGTGVSLHMQVQGYEQLRRGSQHLVSATAGSCSNPPSVLDGRVICVEIGDIPHKLIDIA